MITKKTKSELKEEYYMVMGGKNLINPPFNIGDKIKQRYTTDIEGNLISGRGEFEYVGMKGDLMLIKTLNIYAAHSEDIFSKEAVELNKKIGYNPEVGQTLQLGYIYIYADRFEVINE